MDFIVFSDDWGEHPSSCQHLFRQILRKHRVVWVNTVGMRAPRLSTADLRKATRKLGRMLGGTSAAPPGATNRPPNLHVLQPPMVPLPGSRIARAFNDRAVLRALQECALRLGLRDPVVVATVPNACSVVGRLGAARVVYYCVDDFAEWPGNDAAAVRRMENELIAASDLLVAAGDTLADRLRATGRPVHVLTHGVDAEHFATRASTVLPDVERLPTRRVGFFGLIDERLDLGLVAELAQRRPDLQFVFAGPVVVDLQPLKRLANVHTVGALPYARLPEFVAGVDVLWLPYRLNAFTRTLAPLKLREYLATGRPVVATAIPEVLAHDRWLWAADGVDAHAQGIGEALEGRVGRDAGLAEYLGGHSWRARADEFLGFLGSSLRAVG